MEVDVFETLNTYFPNYSETEGAVTALAICDTSQRPSCVLAGNQQTCNRDSLYFTGGVKNNFKLSEKSESERSLPGLFLMPDLHAVTTLLFDWFRYKSVFISAAFDSLHHLLLSF